MQLPLLETGARFSCGSCTACCDQPWRTMIDADRARALDAHDFSKYPNLKGRKFYHAAADGQKGFFDLAKGEGTKCLFLDTDGLCIIHKELGPAAKPAMCRQFPFLPSRTWTDDRVSMNYGCPAVQKSTGQLLIEQSEEIAASVPRSTKAHKGTSVGVAVDGVEKISHEEYEQLMDRFVAVFDPQRKGDIWSRFVECLEFVAGRRIGAVTRYEKTAQAPMPARMLFAATVFPDTLPAGLSGRLGFFGRMSRLPRLFSLASLSGTYASRIAGRNICVTDVFNKATDLKLKPESTVLLVRYFRSRLWQRMLIGTRLPIVAGLHQHILDMNAIMFFARAEALHHHESTLTDTMMHRAVQWVEFHLANQSRVYEQVLKGWLRRHLCSSEIAEASLRLFAPSSVRETQVAQQAAR